MGKGNIRGGNDQLRSCPIIGIQITASRPLNEQIALREVLDALLEITSDLKTIAEQHPEAWGFRLMAMGSGGKELDEPQFFQAISDCQRTLPTCVTMKMEKQKEDHTCIRFQLYQEIVRYWGLSVETLALLGAALRFPRTYTTFESSFPSEERASGRGVGERLK